MRNILYFLPAIIFLFASCGQNPESNSINKTDTISYTYKTLLQKEIDGAIKDTALLASAKIIYPEINGKSVLADSIKVILQNYVFNTFSSAQEAVDSFVNTAVQAKKKNSGASMNGWFYNCNASFLVNRKGLVVLKIESSSYTGGAHPGSFIFYYNFDSTGKIILWEDLIEPGKKDTIKRINEAALRIAKNIPANQSLNDAGFFTYNDTVPLPSFFAITKEGLLVIYNQYEIAQYSMGIVSYVLPFNTLDGVIKKEWISKIN